MYQVFIKNSKSFSKEQQMLIRLEPDIYPQECELKKLYGVKLGRDYKVFLARTQNIFKTFSNT